MSKEYILAIMEEKTGMLVCNIEVEENLKINVQACDAVAGAEFIAVRDNNADFSTQSLNNAKLTAKKIENGEKTYIPVIIECDMKVSTLDGNEIDRVKLINNHRGKMVSDFIKGLID